MCVPRERKEEKAQALQYLFVPGLVDVRGLSRALGGRATTERKLDFLFEPPSSAGAEDASARDVTGCLGGSQYCHGNEVVHHAPYLYNALGAPWKTQRAVNQILVEPSETKPVSVSLSLSPFCARKKRESPSQEDDVYAQLTTRYRPTYSRIPTRRTGAQLDATLRARSGRSAGERRRRPALGVAPALLARHLPATNPSLFPHLKRCLINPDGESDEYDDENRALLGTRSRGSVCVASFFLLKSPKLESSSNRERVSRARERQARPVCPPPPGGSLARGSVCVASLF